MQGHDECQYISVNGDWTSDKAYTIMKQKMQAGIVPDIVFCHNDGMATGVYKAVVEAHAQERVKILGIDGMPGEGLDYVQLGHQVGTYVYPTHGEQIIRLALDILTGKPYQRENALQGIMVTPENVDVEYLNLMCAVVIAIELTHSIQSTSSLHSRSTRSRLTVTISEYTLGVSRLAHNYQ